MEKKKYLPPSFYNFLDFNDLFSVQRVSKNWRRDSEKRYRTMRIYSFLKLNRRYYSYELEGPDLSSLFCYGIWYLNRMEYRKEKVLQYLSTNEIILQDFKDFNLYLLNSSERLELLDLFSSDDYLHTLLKNSDAIKEELITYVTQNFKGRIIVQDLPLIPRPTLEECASGRYWESKTIEQKDESGAKILHVPCFEAPPDQKMTDNDKYFLSTMHKELEKQVSNEKEKFQQAYQELDSCTCFRMSAICLSIPVTCFFHIPRYLLSFGCLCCGFGRRIFCSGNSNECDECSECLADIVPSRYL